MRRLFLLPVSCALVPVPLELMRVLGSFPEFSQGRGAKPEGTPGTGCCYPPGRCQESKLLT